MSHTVPFVRKQADPTESSDIKVFSVDEIVIAIMVREEVDQDRVRLFKELIKDGHPLEPIEVGLIGEDIYLIDGTHRLEANRKLGHRQIQCKVTRQSQRMWYLEAIRLNSRSSKPLTRSELKESVKNCYQKGVAVDTIAQHLNGIIPGRTIRRYLKPLKGEEKSRLDEQVAELIYESNKSIRDAADQLNVSLGKVQRSCERIKDRQEQTDRSKALVQKYLNGIKAATAYEKDDEIVLYALYVITMGYDFDRIDNDSKLVFGESISKVMVASVAVALLYLYENQGAGKKLPHIVPAIENRTELLTWIFTRLKQNIPDKEKLLDWINQNCKELHLSDKMRSIIRLASVQLKTGTKTFLQPSPKQPVDTPPTKSKLAEEKRAAWLDSFDSATRSLVELNSVAGMEQQFAKQLVESLNMLQIALNAAFPNLKKYL